MTADPNYHSLNSLKVCQDEQIDAYIPDIQYRTRDPRFAEQERFKAGIHGRQRPDVKPRLFTTADFSCDPDKQVYRGPQGKALTCHARNQVNRYRTYDVYTMPDRKTAPLVLRRHAV